MTDPAHPAPGARPQGVQAPTAISDADERHPPVAVETQRPTNSLVSPRFAGRNAWSRRPCLCRLAINKTSAVTAASTTMLTTAVTLLGYATLAGWCASTNSVADSGTLTFTAGVS
jgi:hypothetical protein